jgi:hypothetical protein
MREVVLLDVTEMAGYSVCIAGLDLATRTQIRLAEPSPERHHLDHLDGLAPGDVIDVDWEPIKLITPPHVEDGRWKLESVRKRRVCDLNELNGLFATTSFHSVKEAFGEPWIQGRNKNHAWRPDKGNRSLATIKVRYVRAEQDRSGKTRLAFKDDLERYWAGVPFQDLRLKLHQESCAECAADSLGVIRREFDANRTFIRVGLTRPFIGGENPTACWLQVTNVFARPRTHFV